MDATTLNLRQLFEPDKRFLVPMFQRPYVWNAEAQWRPLWEDVRAVAERLEAGGQEVRPHFLGAIVLEHLRVPISRVDARLVVDGQQRLTTLQLLLEAGSDVCRERGWEKYHRAFVKLTRNDNPLSDDPDDKFKVWPTDVDQEAFRRVMNAESPESLKRDPAMSGAYGESPISQGYVFFSNAIREWLAEGESTACGRIDSLFIALQQKLRLVVIELGEQDDSQLIFETMNARGTPLLPADLIKNHLFHAARQRNLSVENLHRLHWKHFDEGAAYWRTEIAAGRVKRSRIDFFLQHYLTMETGEDVQVAHLYSAFRDHIKSCGRPVDAELERLARYSRVFRGFEAHDRKTRLGAFFARVDDLETTTAHPLLLYLFSLDLGVSDMEAAVTSIESFLMRRLVCQLTTKNYNRVFLEALQAIRNEEEDVVGALRRQLLSGTGDSVRWPSDREFRDAWLSMPIYKTQARRRTRMLLEALEVASRGPKTEWTGLERKLTIEHVLPQSWQEHWPLPPGPDPAEARAEREVLLHTVGNLTLLTKALNPAVSNGPWDKKRAEIHNHSVMILNKCLAELPGWDDAAIRARGESLLGVALELWPRPLLPSDAAAVIPSYGAVARKALASAAPAGTPEGGLSCPIAGCTFVYKKGVMGWDGHVGSPASHANWHPELSGVAERRARFLAEFPNFPVDGSEECVDREYWEGRAHPDAMAIYDAVEGLAKSVGITVRVSYARHYIALGGPKLHFCWLRPQKGAAYCTIHCRTARSDRDSLCARLAAAGVRFSPNEKSSPRIELHAEDVLRHRELLQDLLETAYRQSNM